MHLILRSPLLSQVKHYRVQNLVVLVEEFETILKHLTGSSDSPVDWDEIENANPVGGSPFSTLKWSYWCWSAVQLAYYFGKLEIGYRLLAPFAKLSALDVAYFSTSICLFFSGLTCSGLAKKTGKRKYIKEARKAVRKMEFVMRGRGLNNLHRYLLMQADLLALTSRKRDQDVKAAYDKGIATAGKAGFVQDAALGNELAFEYFRSIGDDYWAEQYLTRACELYYEWGAVAKVQYLKNENASFFDASILTVSNGRQIKSSSRAWFSSGDGSTDKLKSLDLESLNVVAIEADVTKDLSATVNELRSEQRRLSTASSKTSN